MRLSGPTLRDELRGVRFRSLRIFLGPAVLALALYAFYTVGGYGDHEATPKPERHGGIYGTVVSEKQHPVSGASVTISFTSTKEPVPDSAPATDVNGHFYLQDLPAGHYILQATADGFDLQTQSVLVEPGKTVQVKIPLYRQPLRSRPRASVIPPR